MASTNKTPNYDLPQFIATDKPTWLGDVNDAMSKIDAGMEANKSSGESTVGRVTVLEATVSEHTDQIATVTETANKAGETATAAQNAASAASALATTAQNAASEASAVATTAQKAASEASAVATTANSAANAITDSLTFNPANVVSKNATDSSVTVSPAGDIVLSGGNLKCICSNDGSWMKVYGYLAGTIQHTNSSIATTIKFPGMVRFPPSEKYTVNSLGISVIDPVASGNENTIVNTVSIDVNTDGSIDLTIWATIQRRTGIFINISPCMINNKSYGDTPITAAVYNAIMSR
jgi:hypothetical protein